MSSSARTMVQYQHAIPRFILRRFVEAPTGNVKVQHKRARGKKGKRGYVRRHVDPDYVLFYDVSEKTLTFRSIGDVYGEKNLYSDEFAIADINVLEKKFSRLESDAARIIEVIHTGSGPREVVMKRKAVETLRKFLFLQHFRKPLLASIYYDPDHHENQMGRSRIERYMQIHKLRSPREVWTHVLYYYLDTPHYQIVMHATELISKYGFVEVQEKLIAGTDDSESDVDVAHFIRALAYHKQACLFHLCIWEAAEGSEFVLTSNGFGLWEGMIGGCPEVHRLFVISPRHVVVLRQNLLDPRKSSWRDGSEDPLQSSLHDIPRETPVCSVVFNDMAEMEAHKASPRAAEDIFTFKVTQLTKKQTLTLNSVLLVNVLDKGSLTFLSRDCIVRTLRDHLKSFLLFKDGPRYLPLIHLLSPPDISRTVHLDLYIILMRISVGMHTAKSKYDQAIAVVDLIDNMQEKVTLFSVEQKHRAQAAIEFCKTRLNLSQTSKQKLSDGRLCGIAPSLSVAKSEDLLNAMFSFLDTFDLKQSADPLDILQNEMTVVAVLRWAAADGEAFARLERANDSMGKALKGLRTPIKSPPSDRPSDSSSVVDVLSQIITELRAGTGKFKTEYDRAYVLYSSCARDTSNPFSVECKRITEMMVFRFNIVFRLPHAGVRPKPEASVVARLSVIHSSNLFVVLGRVLQRLKYPYFAADGGPMTWLRQCVCVSLLTWMAQYRPDVAAVLLKDIPVIQETA